MTKEFISNVHSYLEDFGINESNIEDIDNIILSYVFDKEEFRNAVNNKIAEYLDYCNELNLSINHYNKEWFNHNTILCILSDLIKQYGDKYTKKYILSELCKKHKQQLLEIVNDYCNKFEDDLLINFTESYNIDNYKNKINEVYDKITTYLKNNLCL